jgi:hypothetical protein
MSRNYHVGNFSHLPPGRPHPVISLTTTLVNWRCLVALRYTCTEMKSVLFAFITRLLASNSDCL